MFTWGVLYIFVEVHGCRKKFIGIRGHRKQVNNFLVLFLQNDTQHESLVAIYEFKVMHVPYIYNASAPPLCTWCGGLKNTGDTSAVRQKSENMTVAIPTVWSRSSVLL